MVWPVTRKQAAEFYRDADVFILPTLSDGFAITQLEAQAHGLPVIASKNCGKVVENGVNGIILDEPSGHASHTRSATASRVRTGWKSLRPRQVCVISSQSRDLLASCNMDGAYRKPWIIMLSTSSSFEVLFASWSHKNNFLSRCRRVGGVDVGKLHQAVQPKPARRHTYGVRNGIRVVLRRSISKP